MQTWQPFPYFPFSEANVANKTTFKRYKPQATMAMHERKWMTSYLFSTWISHSTQSVERLGGILLKEQHLLLMYGYTCHVTLKVVLETKSTRLDLHMLPSHTSHVMQPLDCSIFKPIKNILEPTMTIGKPKIWQLQTQKKHWSIRFC